MPQSAADETFERDYITRDGVSECLHWITTAPRRRSLRRSRKPKTAQSTRAYSRGSPGVISGWLTWKKNINAKSDKRLGLIPSARPAGLVSAEIRFHIPSAIYISPRDVACAAIRKRTKDCPGCILHHPIPVSRACRTMTVPDGRIGCWRHRNFSARCSVEIKPAKWTTEIAISRHLASYSITSSASSCIAFGMSRSSAFAVLRLSTNSNLVACMTGRSAGFSPRKIRPA